MNSKKNEKITKRILIPLEEYERLKKIEEQFESLNNKQAGHSSEKDTNKAGILSEGEGENTLYLDHEPGPLSTNRQLPETGENEIETGGQTACATTSIRKDIFVNLVREKYRHLATLLLNELEKFPLIVKFDAYGAITVKGNLWSNGSLFDYLPITFYELKKKPANLIRWVDLLKELNLSRFIKNKKLLDPVTQTHLSPKTNVVSETSKTDRKWYQI